MQLHLQQMSNAFYKTNKMPLILGCGEIDRLMKAYQISNYITDKEYAILHSHIMPFNVISSFLPQKKSIINRIEHRLNIKINPKELTGINSIFQVNDVLDWEIPIQLCCDLLISKDGIPGTKRDKHSSSSVEYHIGCDEIEYIDIFKTPRLCSGSFLYCLKSIFAFLYKMPFSHVLYGKPSIFAFEFASKQYTIIYIITFRKKAE